MGSGCSCSCTRWECDPKENEDPEPLIPPGINPELFPQLRFHPSEVAPGLGKSQQSSSSSDPFKINSWMFLDTSEGPGLARAAQSGGHQWPKRGLDLPGASTGLLELQKSNNSRCHFQGTKKPGYSHLQILNYFNFCGFLGLLGLGGGGGGWDPCSPCSGGFSQDLWLIPVNPGPLGMSCEEIGGFRIIQDLFRAQIPESSLGSVWWILGLFDSSQRL